MRSVGDAPLIERISSAMMWSRGRGCRWVTGSHTKAGGNSYGFAPATGNLMYCMTLEEKLAYIFDPGQMAVDFVTGVVIGEAVDGIANKLPDAWFKKGFGKESEIWDSQVSGARGEYCFGVDGNEIPCITDYYEVDNINIYDVSGLGVNDVKK